MICASLSKLEVNSRTVIHHKMFRILFLKPITFTRLYFWVWLIYFSTFPVIRNVWFLNTLSLGEERRLELQYNPFLNHPIFSWSWKHSLLNKTTKCILCRDLCKLAWHSLELIIYFVLLWFHQKENTILAESLYVNVQYYYIYQTAYQFLIYNFLGKRGRT